jgi:predicted urease superfamily metal-dependent hydrolase
MGKRANRPEAPSDECGLILLSDEQLADPRRLAQEASDYATRFIEEENTLAFRIGVSHWDHNRALVYTIEAARNLCVGVLGIDTAIRLLEMALAETKQAKRDYEGER